MNYELFHKGRIGKKKLCHTKYVLSDRKRVCGKTGKTDVGRIIIFVGTPAPPPPPEQEIPVSCPSLLQIKQLPLVYHIIQQIIT